MIEPYQWYVKNYKELGFKLENISSASVDLELDSSIKLKYLNWPGDEKVVVENEHLIFENSTYLFVPGIFYLCSTVEYIKVPSTHCAFVNMRSSLARRGLGHKMAGFIDPGFEGQVTLELSCDIPVEVMYRERVVQVIYCKLTEETEKPYVGKYKGQVGPTEAYKVHSSRIMGA